jgi:hypothetical protein
MHPACPRCAPRAARAPCAPFVVWHPSRSGAYHPGLQYTHLHRSLRGIALIWHHPAQRTDLAGTLFRPRIAFFQHRRRYSIHSWDEMTFNMIQIKKYTSRIRFFMTSSNVEICSAVTLVTGRWTCSNSRSSSKSELWGRFRDVASPIRVQSFSPTFSASRAAICWLIAAMRASWVVCSARMVHVFKISCKVSDEPT